MNRLRIKPIVSQLVIILSIISAVSLSGCMSLSKAGDEEIADIIAMINEGRHGELTAMSSNPFLVDGELLHGKSLTGSFWTGLSDAGFSLIGAEVIRNQPLSGADIRLFGETAGVNAFFSRYVPDHSVIIEINSNEGRVLLVLSPAENLSRQITAWGGPY